jgi:hypothetical protein
VVHDFDPGALLGRSYPLPDGSRVCLRMARPSDCGPIRSLARRCSAGGVGARGQVASLELARLVSFDPRRRCVICATALVDGSERLIGVGAVDLDGDRAGDPEPVVADPDAPNGVHELLIGALVGRASALARDRAA